MAEVQTGLIAVEVAYALADRQKIVCLQVPEGTSVREAVLLSGMEQYFPGLEVQQSPLGIFSRHVADPDSQPVRAGDRVEIYRPLLADPKEVRKRRAEKAAKAGITR